MQSEEGRALLTAHGVDAEDPSTFLVLDAGQAWRAWRDALYRLLARNRYRWFGRRAVCYLPGGEP
jgi:predicted DCC family thiol-disulfide oxidoreductase YuxK